MFPSRNPAGHNGDLSKTRHLVDGWGAGLISIVLRSSFEEKLCSLILTAAAAAVRSHESLFLIRGLF